MASYSINFGEVGKQKGALDDQLGALSKVLDDMAGIEESMLSAAQWTAADKKDFTERFQRFMESSRNLHASGTQESEPLQRISDTYRSAEQG